MESPHSENIALTSATVRRAILQLKLKLTSDQGCILSALYESQIPMKEYQLSNAVSADPFRRNKRERSQSDGVVIAQMSYIRTAIDWDIFAPRGRGKNSTGEFSLSEEGRRYLYYVISEEFPPLNFLRARGMDL